LLRCMSLDLAPLRHADCIEQCPLSGANPEEICSN
jgi:hypothetical protein